MLPKIFAKTIPGTKIFRENENFRETKFRKISQKLSEFSHIFAFRDNEKRGFSFNPNLQCELPAVYIIFKIILASVAEPKPQGAVSFW
jgi:hypothetical protein